MVSRKTTWKVTVGYGAKLPFRLEWRTTEAQTFVDVDVALCDATCAPRMDHTMIVGPGLVVRAAACHVTHVGPGEMRLCGVPPLHLQFLTDCRGTIKCTTEDGAGRRYGLQLPTWHRAHTTPPQRARVLLVDEVRGRRRAVHRAPVRVQASLFVVRVTALTAGRGFPLYDMQVHLTEPQKVLLEATHRSETKLAGILQVDHCTGTHAFGTVDLNQTAPVP